MTVMIPLIPYDTVRESVIIRILLVPYNTGRTERT